MKKIRLLFAVDNGMGTNLKGTGLAAEYYPFSRDIVWRKIDKESIRNHQKRAKKISRLTWMSSSLLIVPIMAFIAGYSDNYIVPQKEFGLFSFLLPILLGVWFFILFELWMVSIRNTYPLVEAPSSTVQKEYFKVIHDITLKHNDVLKQIKTPYLANILVVSFIVFAVIPFVYWFYFMPSTIIEFIIKLTVFAILLSLIPNIIWNGIVKTAINNKILDKLNYELENKNGK
ncbi:hypothetical protein RN86_09645 [Streptococcus gordonii]|uniref:hypothetical protein n=1 Tax=Streptococcus gordonii TaxID=1302 RepID=UPI0006B25A24|nr:hypothetical protein [Streptococcus gordonii]ALD72659.1 hypothetical protein RN86_09645 [Streptococcus gordonii]